MTGWTLAGVLVASSSGLTVEDVEVRLRTERAAEIIADLFYDGPAWGSVENGIASGDPRWLEVAGRLYGGCDAGSCFSIKLALGEALLRNAAGVLAVAADGVPASELCSTYGFLADSTEATPDAVLEAISAREETVLAVQDPELLPAKAVCLAALKAVREGSQDEARSSGTP